MIPKALNVIEDESEVWAHFNSHARQPTLPYVVLVEDWVSCETLDVPAVALLGTNLRQELVTVLSNITDRLVIALDNDATLKAIKLKEQVSFFFKQVDVLHLPKDPKDMNEEELDECIYGRIV